MKTACEKLRPSLRLLLEKENLIGAEIGVAAGKNARVILECLCIKKLYLIDAYLCYGISHPMDGKFTTNEDADLNKNMAYANLHPYDNIISWLILYSHKASSYIPDNSLDFVYIDGCHNYNSVLTDILLYYNKVKSGGLISGHDFSLGEPQINGVKKAVERVFGKNYLYDEQDWWVIKG